MYVLRARCCIRTELYRVHSLPPGRAGVAGRLKLAVCRYRDATSTFLIPRPSSSLFPSSLPSSRGKGTSHACLEVYYLPSRVSGPLDSAP